SRGRSGAQVVAGAARTDVAVRGDGGVIQERVAGTGVRAAEPAAAKEGGTRGVGVTVRAPLPHGAGRIEEAAAADEPRRAIVERARLRRLVIVRATFLDAVGGCEEFLGAEQALAMVRV